jgi:hypothetical protein
MKSPDLLERYLNSLGGRTVDDIKHDNEGSYILMFDGRNGTWRRDELPDVAMLNRMYS